MTDERVDVVVVGGGPAGLAAAVELKRLGTSRVVVLDRESEAGGTPRHCHHVGFGAFDLRRMLSGPSYARRRRELAANAGVEIRPSTTALELTNTGALALPDANTLALTTTSPRGVGILSARAVLLATGCRERPRAARLVPGGRPLGVYTTGSLQQLVYARGILPGRRAVVVGAEHVSFSAAHTLVAAGVQVAALVTEQPDDQTYWPFRFAVTTRFGIPVLTRARVTRIDGRRRVERVEIEQLDAGLRETLECDTVVFTGDWIPDHELARSAGLEIDAATRGPRVDTQLRTSRHGVFAAGNLLRGAAIADVAALEGAAAARGIADHLARDAWPGDGTRVVVQALAPLAWVTPSALSAPLAEPPRRRFVFWSNEFAESATVEARQGGELLYAKRFSRLVPNRALEIDSAWIARVRVGGDPVLIGLR